MKAIPRPGPVPITRPTDPARAPRAASRGSNTRSARGPDSTRATGVAAWATIRRRAKTRPCISGATFSCQITWLVALTTGDTSMRVTAPMVIMSRGGRSPATITDNPPMAMPPMIQAIRSRLGPPQVLISTLLTSAPTPAAENTLPATASEVKDTISGISSTLEKESTKLTPA